jgi:hypothetical protein
MSLAQIKGGRRHINPRIFSNYPGWVAFFDVASCMSSQSLIEKLYTGGELGRKMEVVPGGHLH